MRQFTKAEARTFFVKDGHRSMSDYRIAEFQLEQKYLCMPPDVFYGAVQRVLNRDIFPHQLITDKEFLLNEVRLKRAAQ